MVRRVHPVLIVAVEIGSDVNVDEKEKIGSGLAQTQAIPMKGYAGIGLCNPKSPSNVGAVIRAAGCFGATAIYYSGERFERAAKFHQDTHKTHQKIPLTAVRSFSDIGEKPHKLVCVELVEGAIPLPEFDHPENALYIFGPEDGSITQSLVEAADMVVYIPTIDCLNLAATVNVLLYDRMVKQKLNIDHDALIKNSRDMNNKLKVEQ